MTVCYWPGACAPLANFMALERPLKVHTLTDWIKASSS